MTEFSGAIKPSSIEKDGYEPDLSAGRITEIPSNMQGRWVYDGSNQCIYAAYAPRSLAEATDGWLLQKFTWVAGNCTKREIAYNSYSNYLTATYA
jgi:hypothetical protein